MLLIPAKVQGIPCLIRIDSYEPAYAGYRGSNLDDWDENYGPSVEYTVCDRRGRPAPWLASKVTHQDEINILNILERRRTRPDCAKCADSLYSPECPATWSGTTAWLGSNRCACWRAPATSCPALDSLTQNR